jgi:hypothetical protein
MPWKLPSGKYLPLITLADAMVINFGLKNQVAALWNCFSEASVQQAWNEPSTQLVKWTRSVESLNAMIGAEELSNFPSYQMLKTDRNRQSY